MDLFLETFEVGQMIRDVQAIVQPLVEKNGNTLVVDCPDDVGAMHADQTKVRQALFNLLSNAAKFTEHGTHRATGRMEYPHPPAPSPARGGGAASRISPLSSARRGGRGGEVTFAVSDTGIGMTEEQLWAAVRGVQSGGGEHQEPLRRDGARSGDQPPLLPPDGRRPDRREHLRQGLDVHGAAAGRGGRASGVKDAVGPRRRAP